MSGTFTRREAIKTLGAAAVLGGLTALRPTLAQTAVEPSGVLVRRRTLRLAHLTDIHVQPELKADAGMIACLHHVQSLKDKPQLVLSGGDSVMDSFEADDARTKLQWDIWRKALKDECSLPVECCIGNHDIWGGNKARSKTTGKEPNYGKKRAVEMLNLAQCYRSFNPSGSGWHFIVLDSTQPEGDGYRAFLDDEQFDWLQRDLKATDPKIPVLVLSHIPIICASGILWASHDARGSYTIDSSLVHVDAVKIKNLFAQHPNVKLCLSGHLHDVDRVDYNGVTYLCNGAVCGNWWKGRHHDCDEGYAVIDLYDDGGFAHEYIKYGWKASS